MLCRTRPARSACLRPCWRQIRWDSSITSIAEIVPIGNPIGRRSWPANSGCESRVPADLWMELDELVAAKAKVLGRKALAQIATIVTPETLLARHRKLIAQKYIGTAHRTPGRPRTAGEIEALVVRWRKRTGIGAIDESREQSTISTPATGVVGLLCRLAIAFPNPPDVLQDIPDAAADQLQLRRPPAFSLEGGKLLGEALQIDAIRVEGGGRQPG